MSYIPIAISVTLIVGALGVVELRMQEADPSRDAFIEALLLTMVSILMGLLWPIAVPALIFGLVLYFLITWENKKQD